MADDVFKVPFIEDFDRNTQSQYFTTVDANNDGVTLKRHYRASLMPGWMPDQDFHEMEYDSGSARVSADDWYITPKIHFEADKVYSLSFRGMASYDSFEHLMEVKMGQGVTVESMTDMVIKTTSISSSDYKTFEQEFTVVADGDYNIGFHIMSERDKGSLYFGNIYIKQISNDNAPAKINDMAVTPDETGKLSAEITFTAPDKTISGAALTSISKIEISRNGSLIKTLTGITPGQTVSYTDNGPHNGLNSYAAVVYSEGAKGVRANVENVYVGVDIPLPPTAFKLIDTGDGITLSWDAVSNKGANGMVVDPNSVTYVLEAMNSSYSTTEELTRTKDRTFHYSFNMNQGGQDLKRFGVRAMNAAGWGEYAYGRIVVGAPYNLPYRESFATGAKHGLIWQEGSGTYYVTTDDANDEDAGCLTFEPYFDGQQVSFNLGKMNMRQALHPIMKFSYKGLTADDHILVQGMQQDGTIIELVELSGEVADWTTTTVDLSPFAGLSYVIPKFNTVGLKGHTICIDDIEILDIYDYDLSLTIDATVSDDNKAEVSMTITNIGMNSLSDYEVVLSINGEEAVRIPANGEIAAGHVTEMKAELDLNGQTTESADIRGQVVCIYDLNPINDIASVQVPCKRAVLEGSGTATTIDKLLAESKTGLDIYTSDGRLVRRGATSVSGLKKGIYIINKKKVCVTE